MEIPGEFTFLYWFIVKSGQAAAFEQYLDNAFIIRYGVNGVKDASLPVFSFTEASKFGQDAVEKQLYKQVKLVAVQTEKGVVYRKPDVPEKLKKEGSTSKASSKRDFEPEEEDKESAQAPAPATVSDAPPASANSQQTDNSQTPKVKKGPMPPDPNSARSKKRAKRLAREAAAAASSQVSQNSAPEEPPKTPVNHAPPEPKANNQGNKDVKKNAPPQQPKEKNNAPPAPKLLRPEDLSFEEQIELVTLTKMLAGCTLDERVALFRDPQQVTYHKFVTNKLLPNPALALLTELGKAKVPDPEEVKMPKVVVSDSSQEKAFSVANITKQFANGSSVNQINIVKPALEDLIKQSLQVSIKNHLNYVPTTVSLAVGREGDHRTKNWIDGFNLTVGKTNQTVNPHGTIASIRGYLTNEMLKEISPLNRTLFVFDAPGKHVLGMIGSSNCIIRFSHSTEEIAISESFSPALGQSSFACAYD